MKQNRGFLVLGITGGAGSGKTTVVEQIQKAVPTVFLHCDVIAHQLMEPGGASYEVLIKEFGEGILEDGPETAVFESSEQLRPISRPKLSAVAMATAKTRKRLNELTHPLVQQQVEAELARLEKEGFRGVVIVEAALLIEAGFKRICDALWYVHAPLLDRVRRMKERRGYPDDKIVNILAGQLREAEFRANADAVIENPDRENGDAEAFLSKQIWVLLKDYVESMKKMC